MREGAPGHAAPSENHVSRTTHLTDENHRPRDLQPDGDRRPHGRALDRRAPLVRLPPQGEPAADRVRPDHHHDDLPRREPGRRGVDHHAGGRARGRHDLRPGRGCGARAPRGVSTVIAEFFPDKDISEASQEVREAVDLAKTEFPSDVEEPIVSEIDFADFPVLTVNLLTEGRPDRAPPARLRSSRTRSRGSPASAAWTCSAGSSARSRSTWTSPRSRATTWASTTLVGAIQSENTNIPGGSVDVGPENYLVRVNGEFESPDEILDLVVKAPGGDARLRPRRGRRDVSATRTASRTRGSTSSSARTRTATSWRWRTPKESPQATCPSSGSTSKRPRARTSSRSSTAWRGSSTGSRSPTGRRTC